MIYFDNAATTYPKPSSVISAVNLALTRYGGNPGRSGYPMSLDTAAKLYECREKAASLFDLNQPENVVLALNCTHAINMAIKGVLKQGDHVIISNLEHNAVVRPVHKLYEDGLITYDIAAIDENDPEKTVRNFASKINSSTRMIFCLHGSNVFGVISPVYELGAMAKKNGLLFGVDAAQTAGVLPVSMNRCQIDFLCMPGHKGLYGPTGTGLLLCAKEKAYNTIMEGGTGSKSRELVQPDFLPDRLESGTVNSVGSIGLLAGMKFVEKTGIDKIHKKESELCRFIFEELKKISGVTLYSDSMTNKLPIISLNIGDKTGEETAADLARYGIAVRGGLHCARLAHEAYGTLSRGTARIAPSCFSTAQEAVYLLQVIKKLAGH